jgi:hypothetical protein
MEEKMSAISGNMHPSAALRRFLRPLAALVLALPLATCAIPSSSANSGKGNLTVSLPSVATWISRPAEVSKSAGSARAYAFANLIKVEILSSSGVAVIDPFTSSVATSVVGGNTIVSVPYIPSGSGYTVKVSIYNAAVSSTDAVVSGSAINQSVSDGQTTQVSVVCLPVNSTALNLDTAANFTLNAKAETWYSFSASAGQAYAFTLAQDKGMSFVMGLFGGDGKFIASSQTSIVYKPSAAESLYIGVAGYSNAASAPGSINVAVSTASVADVGTIAPNAMHPSGATSYPSDYKELIQALSSIQVSDSVLKDLGTTFKSSDWALATQIKDLGKKIESDAMNSLSSKALKENADLSGSDVGKYFTLTAAQASFDALGITSDGGAIILDPNSNQPTNLLGATGSIQGNLQIDSKNLPTDSGIKYLCCKAKVAGNVNVSTMPNYNGRFILSSVSYNAAADCACGLSFVNPSGVGGKVVIKASASDLKTLTDLMSGETRPTATTFIPSAIALTVTVYTDGNIEVFTKRWTDSAILIQDMSSLFGSLKVTVK